MSYRVLTLIGWALLSAVAVAEDMPQDAPATAAEAAPATASGGCIEKTICVPTWVTEMRTCRETCYRQEKRCKEETVCRTVKVNREVPCEYTVWVREKRKKVQEYEVSQPVRKFVEQKYFEYVPCQKKVTRMREVEKCVPVTETRTVCEDQGCWETREVACVDECGCPGTRCERVWVPNLVQKEVQVTVNKTVCVEEPYTVCIPGTAKIERVRTVAQWDTKVTPKKHETEYTTLVPKTKTEMTTVCVDEQITETRLVECVVCVPYTVEKQVPVRVCKMVPKTVLVPCPCQ